MEEIKLIGSKLTKVSAERKPEFSGKLSIDQNIKVRDIEKVKDSKDTLKVAYSFTVDYKELGKIDIEGILFLSADSKTLKNILKAWKDKKFDDKESIFITNIIIQKASVKAMELEEELGLPIHVKLPTLSPKKKE